jgi:hypothetical protein
MIDIQEIVNLQMETVEGWHNRAIDNPYDGFLSAVCQQHSFNYLLWHEEDIARSPDVGDAEVAKVKRAIDQYNQKRNDWIEKVDELITEMVQQAGVSAAEDAPLNTETPGSTIDRLSILALRIYHLREQLERPDVDENHLNSVYQKIAICLLQQADLAKSLTELITAIFAGQKRHRTYRQFKMYNDPSLNPYLYQSKQSIAGATS